MKRLILAAALVVAPAALAHDGAGHAHDPRPSRALLERVVLGTGENTFATVPDWCKPPKGEHFGATHGSAAVDKDGNIYVTLDSDTQDGFGIIVYNTKGEFVKGIAKGLSGLHSLIYIEEEGKGYLYGTRNAKAEAVKITLDGEVVLRLGKPEQSPAGAFRPTGITVGPDGDIYVADGYASNFIYQYDKAGKFIRMFGGGGQEDGKFRTCHGLNVDYRGDEPRLLICDRENRRLQYFTLEGEFISVSTTDLRRPCAIVFHGETAAIAELAGRAVILDKDNKVISVLGDQPNEKFRANFKVAPTDWKEGVFNAPHGLAFTNEGDLVITEWNANGRVAYLQRIDAQAAATPIKPE